MKLMKKQPTDIEDRLRAEVRKLGTAKPGRKKGESKMTRYRLAKLSGVTQTQLIKFSQYERTLTLATGAKLAKALGLELREVDER